MKQIIEKTVIQAIQPQCDNLHIALKHKKEEKHMTNQDVADITGVPLSNIAKFFSGTLARPDVYNVMSICICLNVSLDELLGNSAVIKPDQNRAKELEAENERLKHDLQLAEKLEHISEKNADRIDKVLRVRSTFMYILMALCSVMVATLIGYLRMDVRNPDIGLVQRTGVSPLIIVVVAAIAMSFGVGIAYGIKVINKLRKKDDKSE